MANIRYLDGIIQIPVELTDEELSLPHISQVGDKLSIQLAFHIAEWQSGFGSGTYKLLILRPTETAAYYVTCTVSGEYALYTLTDTDLQYYGLGRVQLRGEFSNSKKKLSHVWNMEINESLIGDGTAPSPWTDIIDRIEGLAVEAAAEAIEEEATTAATEAIEDKLGELTATATTVQPGGSATVSYDAETNSFTFGLPKGDTGSTGSGVASGGTTGEILVKNSDTDYDTTWAANPMTESGVTQSDLAKLHAVTATATELSSLSGSTAAASDLNYAKDLAAATVYTSAVKNIFNMIYPVGSVYITTSESSPATLFGGSWDRIQGRFLVGCGSNGASGNELLNLTAGAIGGETNHTLSALESGQKETAISSSGAHTHTGSTSSDGAHTHTTSAYHYTGGSWTVSSGSTCRDSNITSSSAGTHSHTVSIESGGEHTHTISGAAATNSHNNLPPYLSVYIWQRITLAS